MKDARVFIIEGITGSGKSVLARKLAKKHGNKIVHLFEEEVLLFSWKHCWIKNIDELRIDLMNRLLDQIEKELKEDEKNIFILDRFHLSLSAISLNRLESMADEYAKFVARIKKLPVKVLILTRPETQTEKEGPHPERGTHWTHHLKKRLEASGFPSLPEMYQAEQRHILNLAEKQSIPYEINPDY